MRDGLFGDVRRFDVIDSTNRYLLEEARAGAPAGVVAVAEFQTSGRGRRGRRWTAPAGSNLLVSVLLRPAVPASQRPLAAAVVALAARDAVRRTCGITLGVKWPNDLVTGDGRKVAGVLAETDAGVGAARPLGGAGPVAVVVGIGVNCNWPDGEVADPGEPDLARAVSLRQLSGGPVDREAVLEAFLRDLAPRAAALDDPLGVTGQRDELRAACTTLGTTVRVDLSDRTIEGTAEGLTDEGHLVVRTAHGAETVVSGDVVHLRAAPPPGGGPRAQG